MKQKVTENKNSTHISLFWIYCEHFISKSIYVLQKLVKWSSKGDGKRRRRHRHKCQFQTQKYEELLSKFDHRIFSFLFSLFISGFLTCVTEANGCNILQIEFTPCCRMKFHLHLFSCFHQIIWLWFWTYQNNTRIFVFSDIYLLIRSIDSSEDGIFHEIFKFYLLFCH